MAYASGTAEVGEDKATLLCGVPESGVMIRNLGEAAVHVGGPDVGNDGEGAGYPVDAGAAETFPGIRVKESPVVPAPPGDLDPPALYARAAPGAGTVKVSWLTIS